MQRGHNQLMLALRKPMKTRTGLCAAVFARNTFPQFLFSLFSQKYDTEHVGREILLDIMLCDGSKSELMTLSTSRLVSP